MKGTTGTGVLRQSERVTQSGEKWNSHTFQAHNAYMHSPVFSATEAETFSCATKQLLKSKRGKLQLFFLRFRVRGTQSYTRGRRGGSAEDIKGFMYAFSVAGFVTLGTDRWRNCPSFWARSSSQPFGFFCSCRRSGEPKWRPSLICCWSVWPCPISSSDPWNDGK